MQKMKSEKWFNKPKPVYLTPKQVMQLQQIVKATLRNNTQASTITKIELECIRDILGVYL